MDFKNHEIDIVIGTQMIAKGLDIPGVDLVGIVSADTGLHLPYFRATEKTFQIITQVSGRSGRGNRFGRTVIQTYWPESIAIQAAAKHDYHTFYENEINERKNYLYPPFCRLIRIISEHKDKKRALDQLSKLKLDLKKEKINFIGPGPCFYARIRDRYRYHIIIKSDKIEKNEIKKIWQKHSALIWDTDPTNLL